MSLLMESQEQENHEQTSGNNQADVVEQPNCGESISSIIADSESNGTPSDLREAVASIGAKLNENLQILGVHLGSADRILANWDDRVRQRIVGMQQQTSAIQQELQAVQNLVRGISQDVQTSRQQCEGKLDALAERFEQRLQTDAQAVAAIGDKLAATTQTLEDKARLISKLETSVAALIREISKVEAFENSIAELNQKDKTLAATVDELTERSRGLRRMTILTSATSAVLALAVSMQMLGGWPVVARYVALWTSSPI